MMPPPPVPGGPVQDGVAPVDALQAEKKELQEKEDKLQEKEDKLQEKEDKLQKLLVKVGKEWEAGQRTLPADIKGEVHEFGIFGGVEDVFRELKQEKADVTAILVQVATESAYEAKRKASLADVQATVAKRTKVSSSCRHHTQSEMWERQGEVHRVEPAFVYEGDWAGWWNGLKTAGSQADSEEELQTAFATRLRKLETELHWEDTHARVVCDRRKPDLSCVVGETAPTEYTIVAVIELTAPDSQLNTATACGQLMVVLTRLLDAQGKRACAKGLLFNAKAALEMCATRTDDDEYAWSISTEKTGNAAWNLLRGFMSSSGENLGTCEPITVCGSKYSTHELRGRGSSCKVYSVADTDDVKNAVIKVYGDENVRDEEERCLRLLHGTAIAPFVPKVVASEGQYLVVTPYAHKFEEGEFCAEHAAHLMGILKHVHTVMGLVHRDVRPANFFNVPQSEGQPGVLLNDWASSVRAGEVVHYAGSPGRYKGDWLPNDGSLYTAQRKDDLYSFVMSCYDLVYPPQGYYKLPTAWEAVCAACRNDADHDTVLDAVMKLLPRAQN